MPDADHAGLLVAVVGPSGAGKDTLMRLAAKALAREPHILFARRIVTRPADGAAEDHDSMEPDRFARAEAQGAFCLTWRAHGLAYGLPASLADSVAAGCVVVANLSRRSLHAAAARFARLAVVEITAPPEILVGRIAARGRETPDEIAERLKRQVALHLPPRTVDFRSICNAGRPEAGAERLARHIRRLAADACGPAQDR